MMTIDDFAAGFSEEPGYLDFGRIGPLARVAEEELRMRSEFLARARFGSLDEPQEQEARARDAVAAVLGWRADQVAVQNDTTSGLTHAMFGLSGTVAMSGAEFPSMRYAAVRAQQALGRLEPVWLDTEYGRVTPGTVRDQLTDDMTAVAVSLVDYRTGYLADLDGIRQVIGDRLLIVDAVQGFGVVDVPWEFADVIASGGQKWVRAGMGTGFLALSDRAAERLDPLLSGWMATEGRLETDPVGDPDPGAGAFRFTHTDPTAAARLAATLERVAELGVPVIHRDIAARVERLLALVDEFGLQVESPRDERERAGIVVTRPQPEQLTQLVAALHNHGISVSQRDGTVRFSVHVSTGDETFALLRSALVAFASATAI